MRELVIYIDGAARGNPGEAGAAAIIYDASGRRLAEVGKYLGRTTNNVAEYSALILGLEEARRLGGRQLAIFSDSELLIRQCNGQYRVRDARLKRYFERVKRLSQGFDKVTLQHVLREKNKEADRLVNKVLDQAKEAAKKAR